MQLYIPFKTILFLFYFTNYDLIATVCYIYVAMSQLSCIVLRYSDSSRGRYGRRQENL